MSRRRSRSGRSRRPGPILPPSLLLAAVLPLLASACAIPRWPVEGPMISPFGLRWEGWRPGLHRGVDLQAPTGTEVKAMAPGRVRFAGSMAGYGRVVWVDHGPAVMTVYAHLSEVRVETGQRVGGRTVLGLSGRSGNAQAPHLHFEVWRWGREVDPVPLLGSLP